ncbi:hypothetical protein FA743_14685 [Paracoccus gahaiensis]|uniref:IS110 family transposase n=2 Tax=Paracoccus gahaiensis TaxID=1706839 RepID=A0A4U0R6U9_9RHOB|nr:hypothetical protein FA743_14685 [Paracoccus gahaiensis]
MRKRLAAQINARKKQSVPADVESLDEDLKTVLKIQIGTLDRRSESVIAQEETSAAKAKLLRSIPGIGPVSAVMLIADRPELDGMTAGEVAAVPHYSGSMRGRRGDRRRAPSRAACVVHRRTCRHLSQSGSYAGRIAA